MHHPPNLSGDNESRSSGGRERLLQQPARVGGQSHKARVRGLQERGELSKGVEIRSVIDAETVKALLLINGGGAVALLTIFSSVIKEDKYRPLASAILAGILVLMFGLFFTILHNVLR